LGVILVTKKGFIEALRKLLDEGIKFTVIGDTAISLSLGLNDLGEDIDLFIESPSIIEKESFYQDFAENNSCIYGQTWLNTPKLTCIIDGEEILIDFYDNIYDFYVPESFIKNSQKIELDSLKIKMISPEEYIALKAYSGKDEDMEKLKYISNLIKKKRLKINKEKLMKAIEEIGDQRTILRRLKTIDILGEDNI
jgi:predicted nucleotidyltransferase